MINATLYPHQDRAVELLREAMRAGRRRPMLQLPTGSGKCLGIGTPVLRYDGALIAVENVRVGDLLMGPDSLPRRVLSATRGRGPLFKIAPVKGEPWVCNDVHVLTLVETQSGRVIDIPLDAYLTRSRTFKHCHKLFQPEDGVDFAPADDPGIPGHFLGLWIADGTKALRGVAISKPDLEVLDACRSTALLFGCSVRTDGISCPTHHLVTPRGQPNLLLVFLRALMVDGGIPSSVLTASRSYRREVLAGIIDGDGYVYNGSCCEVVQKCERTADGIAFLARSLGLRVVRSTKVVNDVEYQRLSISGELSSIPMRIARKRAASRRQKKIATRTGFSVEALGVGDYAGFELEGDGRFLLGDFTVTHNTVIAAHIVDAALTKGKRVVFCVPRLELVEQTVERFVANGIDAVGVIQGQHSKTDGMQPVQVASVQTLLRKKQLPLFDLAIIDEAHIHFKFFDRWFKAFDHPVIGLSATPWSKGLGDLFTGGLIAPCSMQELIDTGFLSPFRVFAPTHPDLSGVGTVGDDYNEGHLSEVMCKGKLVADVVETYQRMGEGRSALLFAVDRAHAKHLQERFEAAGVPSAFVDCETPRAERDEIREGFHEGRYRVVCNVDVLSIGLDWDVRCLILARPTKSPIRHVQTIGRGLRTAEAKDACVILDHGDSHLRLGFVTDIHRHELRCSATEPKPSKTKLHLPTPPRECSQCHMLMPLATRKCPTCGYEPPQRSMDRATLNGRLYQFNGKTVREPDDIEAPDTMEAKADFYGQLLYYAQRHGKKQGWAAHKYRKKVGVWPNHPAIRYAEPRPPEDATVRWIKHENIAYAKSMQRYGVPPR